MSGVSYGPRLPGPIPGFRRQRQVTWPLVQRLHGAITVLLANGTEVHVYLMDYYLPEDGPDALQCFEDRYVWPAIDRAGYDSTLVREWHFGGSTPAPAL